MKKSNTSKKEKMRDLICIAINEIIKCERIDISNPNEEIIDGSIYTEIIGKKSKISWRGIGYGEVRITIWWGIKPAYIDSPATKPLNRKMIDALDVCCSGWLERKEGKWLQGYGSDWIFDTYCSKSAEIDLYSIPKVETIGYNKEGKNYF